MRLAYFFVCEMSGLSKWEDGEVIYSKGMFERYILTHEENKSYQ